MSELYHLVKRLREEGLSRNRDFDALSQPIARRARRIDRWLRGLERDLRRSASVTVTPVDCGAHIVLAMPALSSRREVVITREELALLARDPVLAALLGAAPADNDS